MNSIGNLELQYYRPDVCVLVPSEGVSRSDESFLQRQNQAKKKTDDNRRLDRLSNQVGHEIETRSWAIMYLQYLVKRINNPAPVKIEFTDLPDMGTLSLSNNSAPSPTERAKLPFENMSLDIRLPFEDLSPDLQSQILDRRLKDARIGTEATWATLHELTVKLTSNIIEPPKEHDIAFRVFDHNSRARLFRHGDIRCGNWQSFNVDKDLTREAAKQHILGGRGPKTDYISITTSPRRLWNRIHWRIQEVAVIDLRILRALGIAYGSTTDDLGFSGKGGNRTQFATKYHFLVLGWIPRRSISGFLSKDSFGELLEAADIDTSREADETPLDEYDKKIRFDSIRGHLYVDSKTLGRDEER